MVEAYFNVRFYTISLSFHEKYLRKSASDTLDLLDRKHNDTQLTYNLIL